MDSKLYLTIVAALQGIGISKHAPAAPQQIKRTLLEFGYDIVPSQVVTDNEQLRIERVELQDENDLLRNEIKVLKRNGHAE